VSRLVGGERSGRSAGPLSIGVPQRHRRAAVALLLAASAVLPGCSSADTQSACAALDKVRSSLTELTQSKANTVGEYRASLADVKTKLDDSKDSLGSVGGALVSVMDRAISQLDEKLAEQPQDRSVAGEKADLQAAQAQIEDSFQKLSSALNCPA
jgi:hypothetical protein